MGDIVITEFLTLDGVMEDPGGGEAFDRGGWAFQFERGEEGDRFKREELMASDAQLLGRVTYQGFAAAWPAMDQDEFGKRMNSMPKFVVSRTLENPTWTNTTVLNGDLADEVVRLKSRFERDILVAGSAMLAQSLLAADLVDRINLMVFPVVLGSGKRLFADDSDSTRFTLSAARPAGSTAIVTLRRDR
ncbi:MAG TPA: dihydrofolate reductase family protein [Gaiellales bacterium]|nr:dihydrofolate reductase family protein [Gaiellales bacterium]